MSTTSSSSAAIIPLEASPPATSQPRAKAKGYSWRAPNEKLAFPQAGETWLAAALANPQLTAGDKVLCAALFLHFNSSHYAAHDELIAWPGWETLQAETTFGKTAVYNGLEKLELLGILNIEHGRYTRALKKRTRNRYQAVLPRFTTVNLAPDRKTLTKVRESGLTKVHESEQDSQRVRLSDLRKKAGPPEGASTPFGGFGLEEDFETSNLERPSSFGSPGSAWRPASSAPPPKFRAAPLAPSLTAGGKSGRLMRRR